MAKSSEEERQRFPNLSNLGIAILEHLVESTLGKSSIDEVKKPYAEKQIFDSLGQALTKLETDFIDQYTDQDARDALLQLPIHDLPSISNAIWVFYKRPNDKQFSKLLVAKLKEIKTLSKDQVDSAVDFYLKLLHRELVNIDPELREKIQALAILDMRDIMKDVSYILVDVRDLLREKAIAGQAKSRKTPRKKERDGQEATPRASSSEVTDFSNGSRSRFLDALDSVRFSSKSKYDHSRTLGILYVKAQLFFALIFGDSIVVTENQFFDSFGFIEAFDELHRAAQDADFVADLPIKVALRPMNADVFQAVSSNMGNESFILSLWDGLEIKTERRKLWADSISRKIRPPVEIVSEKESALLDKLWTALEYFTPNRCVIAQNIPAEFAERINRVANLKDDDIDDMGAGISNGIPQRKYFNDKRESEAAKEIRDVLRAIQQKEGEIKTRSLIRRELESYNNDELKEGVIELTDGIYNQTLGIATSAMLIQTSTFPPEINKYVTAGYALSTYVQDTRNSLSTYVHWEIFSYDFFKNLEGLDYSGHEEEVISIMEIARQNVPWKKLLEMQSNQAWINSLEVFRQNLTKLQTVERVMLEGSLISEMRDELETKHRFLRKELKKSWMKHVTNVRKMTRNKYWHITPLDIYFTHPDSDNTVRISYSFLRTKLDMQGDEGYQAWQSSRARKGRMDERNNPTK